MKLATKRLLLRPFTLEDVNAVHAYSKKESVTRFMVWGPNKLKDSEDFVKSVLVSSKEVPLYNHDFIATLKDGTVIGACGLYFKDLNKAPSLGWVIDDLYWNMGYGTEMGSALLRYAFKHLSIPRVYATCDSENIGSSRVMEKIGMRFVGEKTSESPKLSKRIEKIYEITALEYNLLTHKTFI